MRSRTKSETKATNSVQIFSSLAQMRFKPQNQGAIPLLSPRKQASKDQLPELYDPVTMVLQADRKIENIQTRRLKFLASLSSDHFLIGNENQLDMVGFGGITHGFVDTDYYWSLSLKGPIESISVDSKKNLFLILSESAIRFYSYSIKSKDPPTFLVELSVKKGVRFIRFLKDTMLGVFYSGSFEIYNIQTLSLIKKKLDKSYSIDKSKKLLTIPPSIDNIINVFFQEPKEKKQSFILWCLEIDFGTEQIKTRPLYRVYDIMNYAKGKLSIQNFTKEIIFMNLNHQIMAIKNGYLIDTVNLTVKEDGEVLKYLHPNTLLHITKKNVEVYNFSIDMSVKPEKISLKSIDSIEFSKVPQDSFYISVLKAFQNNFAVFFEDSRKKQLQRNGQITYYFQISQNTSFKEKISSLFDSIGNNISNPEVVSDKYNTALKMGLTQKEIYLQLWNHSSKTTLEDYQYILATKDYKIIKAQIEKKLKKESMVLREIIRIEQSCHEINTQLISKPDCTEENIKDFVCSHFLLKKLKLYKQIKVLNRYSMIDPSELTEGSGQSRQLKIDVQQYFHFKNVDIKAFLSDLISDLLFNLKNNAKVIRITLRSFKFIYRIVYKGVLDEIITTSKTQLIDLLNEVPEILPYIHRDLSEEERKENLYEGIWGSIGEAEWEQQLYSQRIETIHNRQTLKEFMKSVWFKRYWLTAHGLTYKSKGQIIENNQFNNSDRIFFYFIAKLYEHSKNNKPFYYQAMHFLQEKYELFPAHLKNKALLYENLYIYYFNEEQSSPKRLSFQEFLQWDDQLLFKYFFDHEKVKKNSLLRQVKPIYEQSDPNGSHLFNIGLFSYFYSHRSEISDLKFILNRINNEKAEFYQKNKGIYEVLIKSIQFKLRLGSGHDIPMGQVMIYVENILLDEREQIFSEIEIMENIRDEAALFQQMRINMTIKQIMDDYEQVISRMIKHKLERAAILTLSDYEQFKSQSVTLLRQVQRIKNKIYAFQQQQDYTLLVYLSFILQEEHLIEKVIHLLEDQDVNSLFQIKTNTIENIVLYMFKWSFSRSNKYIHNAQYLRKLLELLPSDNECRQYLQTQLQIGLILSSEQNPVSYPLSTNSYYPHCDVIRECFRSHSSEFLLSLDLNRLHNLLAKFQHFHSKGELPGKQGLDAISLHKIYEIMIVQLLEKELFKEVIPYIYRILDIESPIPDIGIIYVALYIQKTVKEYNQESKKCIFRLFALFFYHPRQLLKIIEVNITTEQTGLQQTSHLRQIVERQSKLRHNFNHHSDGILRKQFTSHHQDQNSNTVIQVYRQFLKTRNQQFQRNSEYDLIFSILCNSPYLLIKFIQLSKNYLELKLLYSFIIMTITRPIFQRRKAYQVVKRVFAVLLMSSKQIKSSDQLTATFQNKSTDEQFQLQKLTNLNEYQSKLSRIVKLVSKAQTKYTKSQSREQDRSRALLEVRAALSDPNSVTNTTFEAQNEENAKLESASNEAWKEVKLKLSKIEFDQSKEKKIYFFRSVPLGEFLDKLYAQKIQLGIQLVKKRSAAPVISLRSFKDSNYLNIRNNVIEHLYSHKVVAGSQYQDDEGARKDDEDFLDSFLPKPSVRGSQLSVSSSRGLRESRSQSKSHSNRSRDKMSRNDSQESPLAVQKKISLVETQNLVNDIKTIKKASSDKSLSKDDNFLLLREYLVKSYNQTKIPKFDLSPLQKELAKVQQGNLTDIDSLQRKKVEFLHSFVSYIYNQSQEMLGLNMKLIEEIGRKHPEAGVNVFFLQAYQRTFATHDKHGLDMKISEILPLSGIFVKSKDILDLYFEIEAYIARKITDENIFKLSKLIALGFRKSVVEQEILFNYLKILMQAFINSEQSQVEPIRQKIKSMIQKLSVQTLVEKGQSLFKVLQEGQRRAILLQSYAESLKHKGYNSAAKQLLIRLSQ